MPETKRLALSKIKNGSIFMNREQENNMSIQDILTVAKELSVQERLQVAILLLESLKTSHPPEFQYVNVKHSEGSSADFSADVDPLWKSELHPLVQSLIGAVPSEKNENPPELYIDYLEEKYS